MAKSNRDSQSSVTPWFEAAKTYQEVTPGFNKVDVQTDTWLVHMAVAAGCYIVAAAAFLGGYCINHRVFRLSIDCDICLKFILCFHHEEMTTYFPNYFLIVF